MRIINKLALSGALAVASFATQAQASTVVAANCVSVSALAGCLFSGNINENPAPGNANGYINAQNAYNLFNNTHPSANPDISLSYLGDTIGGFPGTFTGGVGTSGTWSLPGYLVDYIAVKASSKFVLYKINLTSGGNWNTFDIPHGRNAHGLSHLVFFGEEDILVPNEDAVPEPATWAMMLVGFGMLGGIMRRRRSPKARVRFAF